MAKAKKKTEEVAASQDAAATPVEKVQETTAAEDTATEADVLETTLVEDSATEEADTTQTVETSLEVSEEEAIARANADNDAKGISDEEAEAKGRLESERRLLESEKGYGFTADAPKRIRYNGEVYSQEEVLNNPELLHELVTGKCAFIKRV